MRRLKESKMKKITIFTLFFVIIIMAIAYATVTEKLSIKGQASIINAWNVGIVRIVEGEKIGNAVSIDAPDFSKTTATFSAQLEKPSDSIEYIITIKNQGIIDAKLAEYFVGDDGNAAIIFEVVGAKVDDVLKSGQELEIRVKVTYDGTSTESSANVGKSLIVALDYVQNV